MPAEEQEAGFDFDVITPGRPSWTGWRAGCGAVQLRQARSPRGLRCACLSDASVPGEGEHKIMEHPQAAHAGGYGEHRHVVQASAPT